MCFQWHLHIISRPLLTWGNSLQLKAYPPLSCLTMDLHSMVRSLGSLPMNLTLCTPHHHPISINPMDSLRPWWRKSRMPTRKLMDPPNAQVKALLQLCDTPIMADLPSPAEILHGHPAQGTVLSRPSKRVNICQIWQKLIKLQEKQKENFDKAHRAKDLCVLKVKEQVQFFPNKQGTGPVKWITGTVTEILECGCLYMVQAPNGRVYRRNRAHLKPICHDCSYFQDHLVKKEKKQLKNNSFQDHQPSKVKSVSFQKDMSYMDTRSMLFDEPNLHQTPPTSPIITPMLLFTQITIMLTPSIISIQRIICGAQLRGLSPEGRKRHQSEPAFIRPCDIDRGLTHRLSALLVETSPLAP